MKKRHLVGTVLAAILVLVLAVILAVSLFISKNYVVIGWQLFPRGGETLDLRDRLVTMEEYDALGQRMPGTEILWSVPLSCGYTDSSSEELHITRFVSSDVDKLMYFPRLKTVDAQSCTDYAALMEAYVQYPEVEFRFAIPISGVGYAPDTTEVTLTSLEQEDIRRMELLPKLTRVNGTGCREFALLRQLKQEHPQWEVAYLTAIAGTAISDDTQNLSLTGAEYGELSVGLAGMPVLKTLMLHNPRASYAELEALRAEYPNVEIHWDVEIFGTVFPEDATEVDISSQPIGSIETAKQYADLFPQLQKLIVDSRGIENEDMAVYRDEVRSRYKVVWTVYLTAKCKARTDDTKFMPIDQGEYYFEDKNAHDLRYCEDMVCIDIGHSTVENVDFIAFMPHLKYLILAWTQVKDITPLQGCKELIYLELDHGIVHDYTPLQGCTALQDLNVSWHGWETDVTPLLKLTWLKNLWVEDIGYQKVQLLIEALPDTRIVTREPGSGSGMGWRNLPNYYAQRDYLGKPYMR